MKYGEHTNGGAVSLKNYFVMMFKLLKFVEIYKNGKASNQNIDLEDWLCCVMHCWDIKNFNKCANDHESKIDWNDLVECAQKSGSRVEIK